MFVNDAFDILKSRNKYEKRNTFNVPISLESTENKKKEVMG
jgi:hypothetical protein